MKTGDSKRSMQRNGWSDTGGHGKKEVKASERWVLAREAVTHKRLTISSACSTVLISQAYYWYESKFNGDKALIADLLIGLIQNQRNCGFGLCFLYLRNVKITIWTTNVFTESIASLSSTCGSSLTSGLFERHLSYYRCLNVLVSVVDYLIWPMILIVKD